MFKKYRYNRRTGICTILFDTFCIKLDCAKFRNHRWNSNPHDPGFEIFETKGKFVMLEDVVIKEMHKRKCTDDCIGKALMKLTCFTVMRRRNSGDNFSITSFFSAQDTYIFNDNSKLAGIQKARNEHFAKLQILQ